MGRVKEAYEMQQQQAIECETLAAEIEADRNSDEYHFMSEEEWAESRKAIEEIDSSEHRETLSSIIPNLYDDIEVQPVNSGESDYLRHWREEKETADRIYELQTKLTNTMYEPMSEAEFWQTVAAYREAQRKYIILKKEEEKAA